MVEEYYFERLTPENISDLVSIYKEAFGKVVTVDFLNNKNNTAWCGISYAGYIAYASATKTPAAFYGVFPCYLSYQGQTILAAQSGDTMTHKDHQGKGLFVTLAKKTYQLVESLGVKVVFGFPNENSYPGFVRKLNWDHYEDLHAYLIRS